MRRCLREGRRGCPVEQFNILDPAARSTGQLGYWLVGTKELLLGEHRLEL